MNHLHKILACTAISIALFCGCAQKEEEQKTISEKTPLQKADHEKSAPEKSEKTVLQPEQKPEITMPEKKPEKALPQNGVLLFGTDSMDSLVLHVRGGAATRTIEPAPGQEFEKVIRVDVSQSAKNNWDIELKAKVAKFAKKDDVLLFRFHVRGEKLQDAVYMVTGNAGVQVASPPYEKLVLTPFMTNDKWMRYDFPFRLNKDFEPNSIAMFFHLGQAQQAVDFGGVELWNFGPDINPDDLPKTVFSYEGREPDAPWRKEALERIEKIRKGDMKITVTDKDGNPITDADVKVRMKKHDYGFGCVVGGWWMNTKNQDHAKRYKEEFAKLFNETVLEGAMKWPSWEDPKRVAEADSVLADMEKLGIPMRGHCMVWPREKWLPKRIVALYKEPEKLREEVFKHIEKIGTHYKGRLSDWDVVNEPYKNHELMDILGKEVIVEWFERAHKAAPSAKLYLNEAAIPDWRPDIEQQMQNMEGWLDMLVEKKAPLHGIGLQGHMFYPFMPPTGLLGVYDRFAKYNLPIKITEFDINEKDEALQGDYMRDFLIATFSHPATHSIIMWGFWDGSHWLGNAPLFRKDWSLKPSGEQWMKLVRKEWWTNADGKTDSHGKFDTRAFYGEYEITVSKDGKSKTEKVNFTKDAPAISLKFD